MRYGHKTPYLILNLTNKNTTKTKMMKPYIKAGLIITSIALFVATTLTVHAKGALFMAPPPTAPANDDCANATTLIVDSLCNFTAGTVDQATQSVAPLTCNGLTSTAAFDVWYKFVAVPGGQIITVKGSASFDAVVLLMDSCSSSTLNNCSDNSGQGGTEVINASGLTVGNTYYIRVYHYGSAMPTTTDFDICVKQAAPPITNDNCSGAILLNVDTLCTSVSGTVSGATQSGPADSCANFSSTGAFDVWYKFVATDSNIVIKVQGALSFDAVIVLKDSCSGSVLNCSDNTYSGGLEVINDSNLVVGHTYYIRVYPYGSAIPSTPDFDICVSLPAPPPAYDNCSGALLIAIDSVCNYMMGSVDGATQSEPADTCGSFTSSAAFDVWYMFVADSVDVEIKVKGSSSFDPVVVLKDGCGGNTIDCADGTGSGGTETIVTSGLTAGNTYYVRVYDYGNALPETPEFEICIALPPPPPANDDCMNAITLTVDSTCSYVQGTVLGATESTAPDTCGNFTSPNAYDVWYKFVAGAADVEIKVKGSSSFDASLALKDSCNGSTITCVDATGSGATESIVTSGLTPGNTYYIRVYDYGSSLPETPEFEICVALPPPPASNDVCANAITLTADSSCTFIQGTVFGANSTEPADSCNGFFSSEAFDVWYKFVAVSSSQTIKVKGSEDFDAIVVLKDGCSGNTLGCSDNTTTGGTEMIEYGGLTPGNTYYVRVYDYGSTIASTPGFEICLQAAGPSGIINESKNNLVNVYPNPATNKITISVGTGNSNTVYRIMNLNGQTVAEGKFSSNSSKEEINLSSFVPGIYNIQVTVDGNVVNKKVVVLNK